MMERRHIKKGLILLLFVVMLVASVGLAACGKKGGDTAKYEIKLDKAAISLEKGESLELPYHLLKDGEVDTETPVDVETSGDAVTYEATTKTITAVKAGKSVLTISVKDQKDVSAQLTVNVPLYEISIPGDATEEVNLGSQINLEYTIRKDDVKITDKKVVITTEGDALKYTSVGYRIDFVKEGTGKVKIALADDPTVYAEKTYTVVKSFWSSEYQVNKDLMNITSDSVSFPGGSGVQYSLFAMDGGTKYVFKTTLKLPSASVLGTISSVGIAHTIDKNNSSLWFGLKANANGTFKIYIKNYYSNWSNGLDYYVSNYDNITFPSDEIECITVRDGNDYWYSIGGLVGTWTTGNIAEGGKGYLSPDANTWVGFYSQENKLTATKFSYSVEDEDIAAAKAICENPVAMFDVTNKGVNKILKGNEFTYNVTVIGPDSSKIPAITWELDTTDMTAGVAGTTISNGTLKVAEDAAGTVVVIAKCGTKEVRIAVGILSDSVAAENETVKVDGGVVLNDDGSVEFTEELNSNNSTLRDDAYEDVYYSAVLKETVKGDFEFAFTLTEMKSASTPKFMVSLGSKLGNFIFSNNSVSLKAMNVNTGKELVEGALTASFVAADTLEVVIKVVGGHYVVTVNGTALNFGADPVRRIEDYTSAQHVMFTTGAGTSVKVSAITLTDKADAEYIILNSNTTAVEDGFESVMIPMEGSNWVGKDRFTSTTYYGALLPDGDYTISMDVKFSVAMADAKLGIQIGTWEYHVNNKVSGSKVINGQLYAGSWGDAPGKNSNITTVDNAFKVTIKKISGTVYFYIGDTLIANHANAPVDRIMKFWTFDDGSTPAGEKVKVTNLSVTAGATIITITGKDTLQVGTSTTYSATVLGGREEDIVWAMNNGGLNAGKTSTTFDPATKTLVMGGDAEGYVVITATIGDVVAVFTVSASSQPADQNTKLAESKGGVKQDVDNGILIFDDAGKNGVADEYKYSEASGYYAILNTAANTRATIQDNFILEFTVSDYVSTAQHPKLMISLGGQYDQFYVVYKNNGKAEIQTLTAGNYTGFKSGDVTNGGHWINSAEFDVAATQAFKLVCEDGFYRMYAGSTEITGWNFNGTTIDPVRNPETMAIPRNIMFSTNGDTTATVSNITLSDVAGKAGKVTATHTDWFNKKADGSIDVTMKNQAHGDRWDYLNSRTLYTYGQKISDNSTITMDIKFAAGTYNDEALLIKFGSKDNNVAIGVIYHSTGNTKVEVQKVWGGTSCSTTDLENGIQLKIVMTNGIVTSVSFAAYDNSGTLSSETKTVTLGGGDSAMTNELGVMSFGTFIYGTPSNNVVNISNIVIANS